MAFLNTKLILILCSLAFLISCSQLPHSGTPTQSSSDTIQLLGSDFQEANKVVALTSLSADIIQRLDPNKLVGISGSPLLAENEAFSDLPKVSEGRTPPSVEKIVALKPDLVIGDTGFHDQILSKLSELGIATMAAEVPDWGGLEDLTTTLAEMISADPKPLLQQYESFLPQHPTETEPTLVLVSNQPIMAPNRESWAGDLLEKFSIQNIVAELQGDSVQQGYITLSPEKILEENPEILILVDVGDGSIEQLKSAPFWSELNAVQNDRIYIFDYYGLVNPGGIDAIKMATEKLSEITAQN